MNPHLLRGNLELILLLILADGPRYGLEIAKEAHTRSEGYFHFKEGSLYPALHRLTAAGLLEGEFRSAPRGGGAVRYYWLTQQGHEMLRAKRAEFERFTGAVRALGGDA
jgi:DNA-binding PadR family transcriptional regulator